MIGKTRLQYVGPVSSLLVALPAEGEVRGVLVVLVDPTHAPLTGNKDGSVGFMVPDQHSLYSGGQQTLAFHTKFVTKHFASYWACKLVASCPPGGRGVRGVLVVFVDATHAPLTENKDGSPGVMIPDEHSLYPGGQHTLAFYTKFGTENVRIILGLLACC